MFCAMPDNIGDKKYYTPWKQKVLTYDFQNYSSLGKENTLNEIENAFSVWQNVCNLKFERVFDGSQVMNIVFLTDDEKQNEEINCPYKLNSKKSGTLAHGLYPGNSTLFGDLHFDNERWSEKKTVSGDGKFNLFSVAVHKIGQCIGLFHNTEDKYSILHPIYKPGFSVENKNNILSESDIKTVLEMYGTVKHVVVMAIFTSNKAKGMIKTIKKDSNAKTVKIIYTLKPKHFSEENISVESFENLLKRLADMNHVEFVADNFGVGDNQGCGVGDGVEESESEGFST